MYVVLGSYDESANARFWPSGLIVVHDEDIVANVVSSWAIT